MPRTGGSFRGLVSYLTSSRGKPKRVGRIGLTHCVSADVASAILEVENHHARNSRARHTTYHLLLSFREVPLDEVLRAIEERACAALGFAGHRRVSVVHHDTENLHVHVAIDRMHPVTHMGHWPSYSKLVLDRTCLELERDFGLVPDRHLTASREPMLKAAGAFRERLRERAMEALTHAASWGEVREVLEQHGAQLELRGNGLVIRTVDGLAVRASSVARSLSRASLESRLGPCLLTAPSVEPLPTNERRRTHDMEHAGGVESLIGWVRRECGDAFRQAQSWGQLHEAAASKGLLIRARGNGLVFVARGGPAVKASSVGREFSRSALERRLGAFEVSPLAVASSPYARKPLQSISSERLYREFREARSGAAVRKREIAAVFKEQRQEDSTRLRRVSQRRWSAIRLVAHGRIGSSLWASYARRADRKDRQLVREQRQAKARLSLGKPPGSSWLGWLRDRGAEGDIEALELLRRRTERSQMGNAIVPIDRASHASAAALGNVVTSSGTIVHHVQGGSIRDDGRRLHLRTAGASDDASERLLRMGVERYGRRLGVEGDQAFRDSLARVAAERRVPVEFADRDLETRRRDLEGRQTHGDPGQRRAAANAQSSGREGRPSASGARRGLQSHAPFPSQGPQARPLTRLRRVSELDVVRFEKRPQGLLPRDALANVDQRRAGHDRVMRRDHAADRLKPSAHRNRGRVP